MGMGVLEQLIARGQPSPIQTALGTMGKVQGLQLGALAPALRRAQTQLAQAQAQKASQQARLPGGGANLPGPAGQVQGIETLKRIYGANSPQVLEAQRGFDTAVQLQKARGDYFEANHWMKNIPTINKTQIFANYQSEEAQRQQQGLPTHTFQDWFETKGKQQLTPEQQKKLPKKPVQASQLPLDTEENNINNIGAEHAPNAAPVMHQTAQSIPQTEQVKKEDFPENFAGEAQQSRANLQKLSSDPTTRAKALNFQTIDQLISGVDPTILKTYAGPNGLSLRAKDRLDSLNGKVIPRYNDYNSFAQITVPTIADKIRQAYGTSITPEMFKILKNVSNPINWKTTPSMALSNWNKLTQLMREQGSIYNRAISAPISTSFIGTPGQKLPGQPVPTATRQPQAQPQVGRWEGNIYISKSGKRFTRAQVQALAGKK